MSAMHAVRPTEPPAAAAAAGTHKRERPAAHSGCVERDAVLVSALFGACVAALSAPYTTHARARLHRYFGAQLFNAVYLDVSLHSNLYIIWGAVRVWQRAVLLTMTPVSYSHGS